MRKSAAKTGSRPVNRAPNQPITVTTKAAIPSSHKTMSCGMAISSRNRTVTRDCGAGPANETWTGAGADCSVAGACAGPPAA